MDGRLAEDAWLTAAVTDDFTQQRPDEGDPASYPTRVHLLYEDDALLVGFELEDAGPDSVTALLGRRDAETLTDWVYIYVDGFGDGRNAFGFGVSAAGVQRDVRISDDVVIDPAWDAIWKSAVARTATGWSAELRIPFSQLRFAAGRPSWGVNFERRTARLNERSYWQPVERGSDRFVSNFGVLYGTGGLRSRARVELIPYAAGRVTRDPRMAGRALHAITERHTATGADVRLGLGSSFVLSATINPDFGQVESDPARVNLSAFEIFETERRQFFVDGAEVFQLTYPTWPPLFHSRRVGRAPQVGVPGGSLDRDVPEATTILGAAKLTGQTNGGWTVGLMQAVTARERADYLTADSAFEQATVEPRTSYTVGRVLRQFDGGRSGIGMLGTLAVRELDEERTAFLHSTGAAIGLDAWHRFAADAWEARIGLIGSHVRGDSSAIRRTQLAPGHYFARPDADHLDFDPTRTSLSGYSLVGRLSKISGSLRGGVYAAATSPGLEVNDLGFNPSLDHQQATVWGRYQDFTAGGLLRSWDLAGSAMVQRTFGGELLELTQSAEFNFTLPGYWGGGVWLMRHRAGWSPNALRGGPALRKPGRWMGDVHASSDRRRGVHGDVYLYWETEDESGGNHVGLSGSLVAQPSDRLRLSLSPTYSRSRSAWQYVGRHEVGDTPLYLVGDVARSTVSLSARADYTFSPDLTLQLFARPFFSRGTYERLREVVDPGASEFDDRFRTFGGDALTVVRDESGGGTWQVDRDGDGVVDLEAGVPDFSVRALQTNAVLRWQYRPGSTVFVVWSHDRSGSHPYSRSIGDELGALWNASGRNVVMVKVTYWLGL